MTIPIKQIILEGSINQVIEEMAVHTNHPYLSKSNSGTSLGYTKPQIQANRDDLAEQIKKWRRSRDGERKYQYDPDTKQNLDSVRKNANNFDNHARNISQTGGALDAKELYTKPNILQKMMGKDKVYIGIKKDNELYRNKPRIIASAKQ